MTPLRVSLQPYRRSLEEAVGNSRSTWSERRGLLLSLEDAAGNFGQGEAAPLPGYSDATLDDCEAALARVSPELLREAGAVELGALGGLLERELPADFPGEARFAVETAVLDLRARRLTQPLFLTLRALIEQPPLLTELSLVQLVASEPGRFGELTRAAVRAGYAGVKVKIGRAGRFEQELRGLVEVRRALGETGILRLDANGALSRTALEELTQFAPEFVEEPFERGAEMPVAPPVPVALDESLRDGAKLSLELAHSRRLVACVLKLGPLGGFFHVLTLARRAMSAGIAPVLSHTLEGPVGTAAAIELALAFGAEQRAPGLARHLGVEAWKNPHPPAYRGARLVPHAAPGLGLPRLTP